MKSVAIFAVLLCLFAAFSVRGHRLSQLINRRIVHGQPAFVNQFPYQAGLNIYTGKNYNWCSGSLISQEWVLTAAACIFDVKIGIGYLGSITREKFGFKFMVTKENIKTHPKYVGGWRNNNIALIKIPAAPLSSSIKPVALPKIGATINFGSIVIASGWGYTTDVIPHFSKVLQYGYLKVISNKECTKIYGSQVVNNGTLCTDHNKFSGICVGDFGGPLVLETSSVQVGIASFISKSGCETNKPNGFTRVTYYLNWIQNETGLRF